MIFGQTTPVNNDRMCKFQRFCPAHSDISLRPSKSTPFDVLRDVIVQTFLFVIRPDLGFYKLEPKLVNVTNLNRKLLKWTEFYVLMRILFFKNFT